MPSFVTLGESSPLSASTSHLWNERVGPDSKIFQLQHWENTKENRKNADEPEIQETWLLVSALSLRSQTSLGLCFLIYKMKWYIHSSIASTRISWIPTMYQAWRWRYDGESTDEGSVLMGFPVYWGWRTEEKVNSNRSHRWGCHLCQDNHDKEGIILLGSGGRRIVTTSINFNVLWSISHLCWEAQRHPLKNSHLIPQSFLQLH